MEIPGFGIDTLKNEGDKRLNCGSDLPFFCAAYEVLN